ncbi:Ribonuclease III domain [Sesbania bispinosa]|nr:Ribonuclease III domain [Sesbania bispinosa]
MYHCYLIELKQDFQYDVSVDDIVLAIRSELDLEITATQFEMCAGRGNLSVNLKYVGTIYLSLDQVQICRRFQTTLFRILLKWELNSVSDEFSLGDNPEFDYLLLPATVKDQRTSNSIIDWKPIVFSCENESSCECKDHALYVHTKDGSVCSCKLKNCVVSTPHNGYIYIIYGVTKYNGNSLLYRKGKEATTFKEYNKIHHGIELQFEHQSLLRGRSVFKVSNNLQKCRLKKKKGPSMNSVELPPELCSIIMSPIAINTIYSFSFIPSIMHRLESLLIAFNLKKMLVDHCMQGDIPLCKVLEAITAKECQEACDYDSLETLGDSFLKYVAGQQVFKTNQNHREGLLTQERNRLISNDALFNYGCSRRLTGFIRKETLDPNQWVIPGDKLQHILLEEELVSSRIRVYVGRRRKIKAKVVADVVEALIGAFLSIGDEEAAISFINWIGIKIDTNIIPDERHLTLSFSPEKLRLEFLGDAVLDYVITMHFYNEYPVDMLSSEFLTDMRSISVNNECYALSAIKAKLHEHILCDSQVEKQIAATVKSVEKLPLESTFGWELETHFSQVLADVIESIAGAIFVDSGYKKEVVFQSIKPLLEPLVTPETAKRHPIKELKELCQREHYERKETMDEDGTSVTIEVEVDGITHKHTAKATNKAIARKVASKEVLKLLKVTNSKL